MMITQLPISDILTKLIQTNTPGADNAKSQVNDLFAPLMKDLRQAGENGPVNDSVIKSLIVKNLKNNELSDQIKNALTSGGKISLEVNNPKDILTDLLVLANQLKVNTDTSNNVIALEETKLQTLLQDVNLKNIDLQDQEVITSLKNFQTKVEIVFSAFENRIKDQTDANPADITALLTTLENTKNQLKTDIDKLTTPTNKEININLSKVKLIIPEIKIENNEIQVKLDTNNDNETAEKILSHVKGMIQALAESNPDQYAGIELVNFSVNGNEYSISLETLLEDRTTANIDIMKPDNKAAAVRVFRIIDPYNQVHIIINNNADPAKISNQLQLEKTEAGNVQIIVHNDKQYQVRLITDKTTSTTNQTPEPKGQMSAEPEKPVTPVENVVKTVKAVIIKEETPAPPQQQPSTEKTAQPESQPVQQVVSRGNEQTQQLKANTAASTNLQTGQATAQPITTPEPKTTSTTQQAVQQPVQTPAINQQAQPAESVQQPAQTPVSNQQAQPAESVQQSVQTPVSNQQTQPTETAQQPVQTPASNQQTQSAESVQQPVQTPASNQQAQPAESVQQPAQTPDLIKNTVANIARQVLEQLQAKPQEANGSEVMFKINAPLKDLPDNISTQLAERIDLLKQLSAENLSEIELKIAPDKEATAKMETILNRAINNIRHILSQELKHVQNNTADTNRMLNALKVNLNTVIKLASEMSENNEVKIVIPGLPAKPENQTVQNPLNQNITTNPAKVDIPGLNTNINNVVKNPAELTNNIQKDTPKIDPPPAKIQTPEAEIEIKSEDIKQAAQNTKTANSQFDKSINISKAIAATDNNMAKISQKVDDTALDALFTRKAEYKRPEINVDISKDSGQQTKNFDTGNKNILTMFLNNQSDPALAGLKNNKSATFTNSLLGLNQPKVAQSQNPVVNQIINQIRNGFNKNELTVSLRPSELGNVNVSVSMQRGVLVAQIVAETAKAMEALKTGTDSLRQTLIDQGIKVDRIVVASAEQSSQAQNNNHESGNKENAARDQSANNNQQQENGKSATKAAMENQQFKQSQQGRDLKNLAGQLDNKNNEDDSQTNNTTNPNSSDTTDNYINTEKGLVNYRV
jgi:hypothetical protein